MHKVIIPTSKSCIHNLHPISQAQRVILQTTGVDDLIVHRRSLQQHMHVYAYLSTKDLTYDALVHDTGMPVWVCRYGDTTFPKKTLVHRYNSIYIIKVIEIFNIKDN